MSETWHREKSLDWLAMALANGNHDLAKLWENEILRAFGEGRIEAEFELTKLTDGRTVWQPRLTLTLDDGSTSYINFAPEHVAAWLRTIPNFTPPPMVLAWLGEHWQGNPQPVPHKDRRQTGRREKQILTIEETARALGYDPLDIPETGKAAIRSYCLQYHTRLFTPAGFAHAWKKANTQGRISISNKERYLAK